MFLQDNKQKKPHAFLQTFLSMILILTLLRTSNDNTVEPRLSGFLDYPDFFSGLNLVMNSY